MPHGRQSSIAEVTMAFLALQTCASTLSAYPVIPYPHADTALTAIVTALGTINNQLWIYRPPNIYRLEQSTQWQMVIAASSLDVMVASKRSLFVATYDAPYRLLQLDEQGVVSVDRPPGKASSVEMAIGVQHVFVACMRQGMASVEVYQPATISAANTSQSPTRLTVFAVPTAASGDGGVLTHVYRVEVLDSGDVFVMLTNVEIQTAFICQDRGANRWDVRSLGNANFSRWRIVPNWLSSSTWLALGKNESNLALVHVSTDTMTIQDTWFDAVDVTTHVAVVGLFIEAHSHSRCLSAYALANDAWVDVACLCFPWRFVRLTSDPTHLYLTFDREVGMVVIDARTLQHPGYTAGTCTPPPTTKPTRGLTSRAASVEATLPSNQTSSSPLTSRPIPDQTPHPTSPHEAKGVPTTAPSLVGSLALLPVLLATGAAILAMLCLLAFLVHRHQKRQRQDRALLLVRSCMLASPSLLQLSLKQQLLIPVRCCRTPVFMTYLLKRPSSFLWTSPLV